MEAANLIATNPLRLASQEEGLIYNAAVRATARLWEERFHCAYLPQGMTVAEHELWRTVDGHSPWDTPPMVSVARLLEIRLYHFAC